MIAPSLKSPTPRPILHTLGYLLHDGGHGPAASDWPVFLDFVRMHLLPAH